MSRTDLSQRALALFDELLDLDATARKSRLEELATAEPELHARVSALLHADAQHTGVLEHRPDTLFPENGAGDEAGEDPLIGQRIGPWRILGIIGRGGMGAVYRGERAEGEFHQLAAIKLIRVGLDHPDLRRRFLRERQILARLRHPNIATLLDGGVTEHGAPYFAMELIDGAPIDTWCDQNQADLRTRVRLFLQVCHAVQHAHQNLTVHRDLKPSNILVTPDGQARLLDFGIAKLLEEEAEGATVDRPFTPEYAAPEQLRGQTVTTATDLYSLGVVLYALLSGAHPLGVTSRSAARSPAAMLGREPESLPRAAQRIDMEAALARGLSPRALAAALRGDLAAILQRCLQPDPARRYASAEALGQDLKAWLDGRAVSATRGEQWYRLRKFAWRHRFAVAASLGAFLAISVALGLAVGQAREARRQAQRAQANAEAALAHARKAQSTRAFAVSLLSSASPLKSAKGTQTTAVELLQAAAQRVDGELAADPDSQAELRATIGASLYQLGDRERGVALIERGLTQMEQRRIGGLPRVDALQARAIARREAGDDDGAERDARAALAQLDALGGDQRLQRIKLRTLLATVTALRGDLREALVLNRANLADRTALLGAGHEETAVDWNNLANAHLRLDECAQAEAGFERADAILRQHKGADFPRRVWPLLGVAAARLCRGERLALTEQALDDAEQLMRTGLGPDHPIGVTLRTNRGSLRMRQGDAASAQREYTQALDQAQRLRDAGASHIQGQLGVALLQQGQTDAALAQLSPAVAAMARDRVASEPVLNRVQAALGRARFLTGEREAGEREIRAALGRLKLAGFDATDDYAEAANDLAVVLAASGRTQEAGQWRGRAHATLVRVYGPTHPRTQALAGAGGGATGAAAH